MSALARQPSATQPAATSAIAAQKLCKTIDDRAILQDLTFSIPSGAYVALLGANGAGKSTLMRILSMLVTPTSGDLTLFGKPLAKTALAARRRIGLISHQAMLYRDLSPRENLVLFGKLYGVADAVGRAMRLLEIVNLADRADDPVKSFSRGMTQRVAIARALMHDPDLLLADEPFSGLDAPSIDTVERILAALHASGRTVVLANHDIDQTLRLAGHAMILRRGRLVVDCPAADLDRTAALKEIAG